MTYNELKEQVASLGFERTVSDDNSLLRATERALSILRLDFPVTRTAKIYVRAPRLRSLYRAVLHNGGEWEELELFGTAFSFVPHGDGEYTVFENDIGTRVKFYAANGIVKGAFSGGRATIRFEGEVDYTVTSLASFDGGHAIDLSDVCEYGEQREIRLCERIGDFGAPAGMPVVLGKGGVGDVTIRADRLYVPFTFNGEIGIEYYPTPIPPKKDGSPLDLPSGTEQLFPLLVSSFIWLDDDEGKAQYYMALYRDGVNRLLRITPSRKDGKYRTNGWA